MPRSANGIHCAHGLTAWSSAVGGETIAGSAANRSASFQSGASVHPVSVNVALMTMSCAPAASWTPSMLACWPSTLNPAATLGLVRTCNTPGVRARIVPRMVSRVTASGGRSSADGGSPIVADGRLKNHTGNSSSARYAPGRDCSAPWICRPPIGARVPALGSAGAINHIWAGRLNARAQAIVNESSGPERLPAKQQENHHVRAASAKRLGSQPEQQRQQQAQNQGIRCVIERGAVKEARHP